MYCSTCGRKLQNAAKFCSSCGTNVTATEEPRHSGYAPTSAPNFVLRPVFVPWVTVLSVLPLQIFLTIWGTFFFGGFATVGLQALGSTLPKWAPFVISGCVFFFGLPILVYVVKQRTYAKTRYEFYGHKLDYYEGFFTTEEKSIDYDNVTEVNLRKGVFQKMYGLGTIVLSTPATSFRGRARAGISISDIKNPDRVYQQIKELIKRF